MANVATYKPLIQEASRKYGVPARVLAGLIDVESRGNINAISPVGAFGLTQFMPGTAKSYGVRRGDARSQIMGAAKYLKDLGYGKAGRTKFALGAYNGGPGNPQYGYAQNVLSASKRYAGWDKQGPKATTAQPRATAAAAAPSVKVTANQGVTAESLGIGQQQKSLPQSAQGLPEPAFTARRFLPGAQALPVSQPMQQDTGKSALDQAMSEAAASTARTSTVTGAPGAAAAAAAPGRKGNGSRFTAGPGWGGSEGVANPGRKTASRFGVPVTSGKRWETTSIGSSTSSDHYEGNKNAYALDFGTSGNAGTKLARALANLYGVPTDFLGTYNRHTVTASNGVKYSIQILWHVPDHYDHVHLGVRRVG